MIADFKEPFHGKQVRIKFIDGPFDGRVLPDYILERYDDEAKLKTNFSDYFFPYLSSIEEGSIVKDMHRFNAFFEYKGVSEHTKPTPTYTYYRAISKKEDDKNILLELKYIDDSEKFDYAVTVI